MKKRKAVQRDFLVISAERASEAALRLGKNPDQFFSHVREFAAYVESIWREGKVLVMKRDELVYTHSLTIHVRRCAVELFEWFLNHLKGGYALASAVFVQAEEKEESAKHRWESIEAPAFAWVQQYSA